MKVKVQSCNRETRKTKDGREYTGIKVDGKWLNLMGDHRDKYNKEIDIEVRDNWAQIITPAGVADLERLHERVNGLAGVTWDDYSMMMSLVFDAAKALEPDDAQARAAMVNTALIAFTNGKIRLADDDKESDAN